MKEALLDREDNTVFSFFIGGKRKMTRAQLELEKSKRQMGTMFKMQDELNKQIERSNDVSLREVKAAGDLYLATLDEIGELDHELKPGWVYWRKKKGYMMPNKVLEELVDIWHFIMTEYLLTDRVEEGIEETIQAFEDHKVTLMGKAFKNLTQSLSFSDLVVITQMLGYTLDDIFECYLQKNQTNVDRQNNGY